MARIRKTPRPAYRDERSESTVSPAANDGRRDHRERRPARGFAARPFRGPPSGRPRDSRVVAPADRSSRSPIRRLTRTRLVSLTVHAFGAAPYGRGSRVVGRSAHSSRSFVPRPHCVRPRASRSLVRRPPSGRPPARRVGQASLAARPWMRAKRSPGICEDVPCEIQFAYLSREDIVISVPEISRGSKSQTVAKN
jgi:hypothetical protein